MGDAIQETWNRNRRRERYTETARGSQRSDRAKQSEDNRAEKVEIETLKLW